ncbi:helix-turn-helix transcriptional regulator [Providencia stuartii]|nr:helix-turn-helix transcriptional regulator [Providencia stuartii]NPD97132.1 helix-turn-helix transcriptional regulator [Providencia stuartii]
MRQTANELLKDMAEKLGISVAQLSAIELGKRNMSAELADKLLASYNLSIDKNQLSILIDTSQQVYKENFGEATEKQRDAFVMFARKYKEMSDSELDNLISKLNE